MRLATAHLNAFLGLVRAGSFSKAAKELHITQPAFSIRIRELERNLETTLVRRVSGRIELTEAGHELLRYCQLNSDLEDELLERIGFEAGTGLGGAIRVAGSSSVMRPIVFGTLAKLIRDNPRIHLEFYVREIVDLVPMLNRAETDFVILNHVEPSSNLNHLHLGYENIVVIESSRHRSRDDVYLDADPKDLFTEKFLRAQGKSLPRYRRDFLQDEFGIHEGVALGFGRAVVHQHMIPKGLPLRMVKGFKPYKEPVVLHYMNQPYYSALHQTVVDELKAKVPVFLKPKF